MLLPKCHGGARGRSNREEQWGAAVGRSMGAKGASRGSTTGGAEQASKGRGAAKHGDEQSKGSSKARGAAPQGGREKEREGQEEEERGPELRGSEHKTKTKRTNTQ